MRLADRMGGSTLASESGTISDVAGWVDAGRKRLVCEYSVDATGELLDAVPCFSTGV